MQLRLFLSRFQDSDTAILPTQYKKNIALGVADFFCHDKSCKHVYTRILGMAAIVRLLAFCLYHTGVVPASRGISWLPWPPVVSAGGLLPVFVWFTSFFSLTLTLSPERASHSKLLLITVHSTCRT